LITVPVAARLLLVPVKLKQVAFADALESSNLFVGLI
jgi:hypothetical protein